jgi:hypothetical protein
MTDLLENLRNRKSRLDKVVAPGDQLTIALGILGFVLIYLHFPFAWSLPDYALY